MRKFQIGDRVKIINREFNFVEERIVWGVKDHRVENVQYVGATFHGELPMLEMMIAYEYKDGQWLVYKSNFNSEIALVS
jgi:hypothetical protein